MVHLETGQRAPNFKATTDQNKCVELSDFLGKKIILYFYPKDDTSGCTKQACEFRDNHEKLFQKNIEVIGVSPDNEISHQNFKSKYQLPYTLLVDKNHEIANAYGTWGEKSMYGNKYMGIIRSHFIIDEKRSLIGCAIQD